MAGVRRALGRLRRAVTPAPATPPEPRTGEAVLAPSTREAGSWLRHGRDEVFAQLWPGGGWRAIAAANLAAVEAALAGFEHWVFPGRWDEAPVVVVRESDRARVAAALQAALGPAGFHVTDADAKGSTARLLASGEPEGARWRLFVPRMTPAGEFLAGAEAGCELQFWWQTDEQSEPLGNHEVFEPGSLVAPVLTSNRWTHVLPADLQQTDEREVRGVTVPVPAALDHPHVFDTRVPIDLVYTWVDGSDPAWQARRNAALAEAGRPPAPLADNPSRYLSHDELRYSLRSVEFYADWVNHLWLVTDGQVPAWLRTDHPRLTVVDHREIFTDPGVLPVFNSHAIESQLHHIEGLAEHFVYLNDDFFFTAPTPPEQFVLSSGLTTFHPSSLPIGLGPLRPADTPVVQAAKQNRDLLQQRFGSAISQRIKHVPYALRRSVLAEAERTWPEVFARTAAARFRSPTDSSLVSSFGLYYGYLTGRAVPAPINHAYADIANPSAAATLQSLRALRNRTVLCLNDTATDPDDLAAHQLVRDFLAAYFPYPSSLESQEGNDGMA